jgi:hypothetical protein
MLKNTQIGHIAFVYNQLSVARGPRGRRGDETSRDNNIEYERSSFCSMAFNIIIHGCDVIYCQLTKIPFFGKRFLQMKMLNEIIDYTGFYKYEK